MIAPSRMTIPTPIKMYTQYGMSSAVKKGDTVKYTSSAYTWRYLNSSTNLTNTKLCSDNKQTFSHMYRFRNSTEPCKYKNYTDYTYNVGWSCLYKKSLLRRHKPCKKGIISRWILPPIGAVPLTVPFWECRGEGFVPAACPMVVVVEVSFADNFVRLVLFTSVCGRGVVKLPGPDTLLLMTVELSPAVDDSGSHEGLCMQSWRPKSLGTSAHHREGEGGVVSNYRVYIITNFYCEDEPAKRHGKAVRFLVKTQKNPVGVGQCLNFSRPTPYPLGIFG